MSRRVFGEPSSYFLLINRQQVPGQRSSSSGYCQCSIRLCQSQRPRMQRAKMPDLQLRRPHGRFRGPSTSVQDIRGLSGLPFTTRSAWIQIQSECPDLRRTHAHLKQGTRPSKKITNIKNIKRYLNVIQLIIIGGTSMEDSFRSKILWSIWSKALAKSNRKILITFFG